MKKSIFILTALATLALGISSCSDTNAPGKTDENSVPALTRQITKAKVSEANKILTDKGFTQVEATEGYVFFYPATLINEDDKTREQALQKEWVQIQYYTEGTNYVNSIEGDQHCLTAKDAFAKFQTWETYLRKTIDKPSFHIVMIQEGNADQNEPFFFREGAIYETYKTAMLAQLEQLYEQKVIYAVQYEEDKAALSVTYADYEKKMASLSFDKEFSIYDMYVELTNAYSYQGISTTSIYENSTSQEEFLPSNTLLKHTVFVGNVEEIIGDYILQN
ncbi:MAG: hypothetical protein IJS82_00280 [Paludibacteraceae bacterium]|nr:hypothetical protein [Paludibacteraceae bacterium]